MTKVELPEVMDKASLSPLAETMANAIASGAAVQIDAGLAGRIGLSAIQLLVGAAASARAAGCAFEIVGPSAELVAAAALAGVETQLGLAGKTGAVA